MAKTPPASLLAPQGGFSCRFAAIHLLLSPAGQRPRGAAFTRKARLGATGDTCSTEHVRALGPLIGSNPRERGDVGSAARRPPFGAQPPHRGGTWRGDRPLRGPRTSPASAGRVGGGAAAERVSPRASVWVKDTQLAATRRSKKSTNIPRGPGPRASGKPACERDSGGILRAVRHTDVSRRAFSAPRIARREKVCYTFFENHWRGGTIRRPTSCSI